MSSTTDEFVDNSEESHESYLLTIVSAFGNINNTESLKSLVLNNNIKSIYWIFIIQYGLLAFFGIITNIIIIIYVVYHKLFKDITHAFIINLCLCHVVQCSVVLPITLLVMLTENWIYGQFLCYFLPMLQDIPLHVAMISHLLIAWDRMRWLGDPLKGRLPTFVCCCASWLTGMVIALPYPIYTIYLDLGDYVRHLKGVGLCVVNLIDDMHEYMRGLFVIMYCGPVILLAYLYIRTSAELRPPDGPFAVMMFEHRAELRNRQRYPSTSSDRIATGRQNSNRSYDLYSAELDVSLEKRTQINLGSMAATQVLCVCPLMVLRLAKMVMVETYENSKHFDFTYLMFVWIAFLPTIIFPGIYASQILPGTEKERLRGYFRMSSKKSNQTSNENSIEQEITTTTEILNIPASTINDKSDGIITTASTKISNQLNEKNTQIKDNNHLNNNLKPKNYQQTQKFSGLNDPLGLGSKSINNSLKISNVNVQSSGLLQQPRRSFANSDSVNNSCSNITSSTYCNNGSSIGDSNYGLTAHISGVGQSGVVSNYVSSGPRGSIDYDNASILSDSTSKDSYFEKKWLNTTLTSAATIGAQDAIQHKDIAFSDSGSRNSSFPRNDSSSTFERDLEIIDLLERERSMDIQDMMQREIHGEFVRNYSMERRRLPDLEKICKSPKILDPFSVTSNRGTSVDSTTTPIDKNYSSGYFVQGPSSAVVQQQRLSRQSSNNSSAGAGIGRKSKQISLNTEINKTIGETEISGSTGETHLIGGFSESDVAGLGGANLIVGSVCDNVPTSGKIPLLENRMKRNQRNQSSNTSFGRHSSIKSKEYPINQSSSRPSLDFRENILAQL